MHAFVHRDLVGVAKLPWVAHTLQSWFNMGHPIPVVVFSGEGEPYCPVLAHIR